MLISVDLNALILFVNSSSEMTRESLDGNLLLTITRICLLSVAITHQKLFDLSYMW